jgi:hypothetical protein
MVAGSGTRQTAISRSTANEVEQSKQMSGEGSTTCAEQASGPSAPSATIPVGLDTFRKSMLDCDIYIRQDSEGALTLYRKKSHPLSPSDLDRLAKRGIHELYVSRADQEAHRRSKGPEVCRDTTLPPTVPAGTNASALHRRPFQATAAE